MNIFTSCRLIQTAWMPEYAAYMIEGETNLRSSTSLSSPLNSNARKREALRMVCHEL